MNILEVESVESGYSTRHGLAISGIEVPCSATRAAILVVHHVIDDIIMSMKEDLSSTQLSSREVNFRRNGSEERKKVSRERKKLLICSECGDTFNEATFKVVRDLKGSVLLSML